MNDIVSIRKMAPLPDAAASCGLGAAGDGCSGSTEIWSEDFFFGGNDKSLAVRCEVRARSNAVLTKWREAACIIMKFRLGRRMLPFKLIYSDDYFLPIGSHVFPAEKYKRVHDRLLAARVAEASDFVAPRPASDEDILLVHTSRYVEKLKTGTLSAPEELAMEIPYSLELVQAFWLAAGGSMLAADYAISDGVAINIGGGFHHAFPDHGEGFCMINDVAVAIRCMQRGGKIRTAMTIDCDVHHGNGTAAVFAPVSAAEVPRTGKPSDVFTISLHQENNYPAFKPPSSLDINLPDGVKDAEYLARLGDAFSTGLSKITPELICYVAGADPYFDDQLGGLSLTIEGLKQRDALVFQLAKAEGIPVMVTFAGGYARKLEDTVTIHSNTIVAAKEVFTGK
jgi:acetoin utilization deacetylase AcuC-like enzyme